MRPGIIARTLPLSPQATTVTYRCPAKWRWSVVGREAGGAIRFRCPQCAGGVLTTATTRNPTATSRNKRNRLPIQSAPDTEYCCDGTVVVRLDLDNHQRCPYGTWAWKTDYSGRNRLFGNEWGVGDLSGGVVIH